MRSPFPVKKRRRQHHHQHESSDSTDSSNSSDSSESLFKRKKMMYTSEKWWRNSQLWSRIFGYLPSRDLLGVIPVNRASAYARTYRYTWNWMTLVWRPDLQPVSQSLLCRSSLWNLHFLDIMSTNRWIKQSKWFTHLESLQVILLPSTCPFLWKSLVHLPSLTSLDIAHNHLSTYCIHSLLGQGGPGLFKLKLFNISHNSIEDPTLLLLSQQVQKMPSLTHLNMSHTLKDSLHWSSGHVGSTYLSRLLQRLPIGLEILDLSSNQLGIQDTVLEDEVFPLLERFPYLHTLNLSYNYLFPCFPPMQRLRILQFSHNLGAVFDLWNMYAGSQSIITPLLQELSLSHIMMNPCALHQWIPHLHKMKFLTHLRIANISLSTEYAVELLIDELPSLTNLVLLDMSENDLDTPQFPALMCSLPPSLETLILLQCRLHEPQCIALANHVYRLPRLKQLQVSGRMTLSTQRFLKLQVDRI
ncbi:MAG: hypothetical protein Sylvanvirus28_2 [Sylvanvirus sp.]|uniref:Uncharacterized protein n=1 Tax=Sylvanvirus sp. TaxID=2487774 RepID=A0A3G5AJ14_9VIRU|nr:MAG: hypothetical protein Sylvanvirus28_2 [Sylvanvirus sp.]